MSICVWDESLAIGHKKIDEQHKVLITIMSRMAVALSDGASNVKLFRIFRELHRYSSFHFNEEEALMTEGKFSVWCAHRQEHQRFVEALDTLAAKLESGGCQISPEILEFLVGWHLEHNSVSDKKLVACLP